MKPSHACDPIAYLSDVHFLTGITINHVATLKVGGDRSTLQFLWGPTFRSEISGTLLAVDAKAAAAGTDGSNGVVVGAGAAVQSLAEVEASELLAVVVDPIAAAADAAAIADAWDDFD
jgi:hypothetical protein